MCVGAGGGGGQVGTHSYISPGRIPSFFCITILSISATQDANPLNGPQYEGTKLNELKRN
jgi:hypothetical protein